MTSSGSAVAGLEERVRAGVERERDPGLLAGLHGRLDGAHRLVQRLALVLEVGADDADVDRAGHGAARVAVAALEVGGHGQVGLAGDETDLGDHLVARDDLAVGIAAGGGDAVAGRRERRRAGGVGHDAGGDRVPHVHHEEQLRGGVQPLEFLGLVEGAHTAANPGSVAPDSRLRGGRTPRRAGAAQTGGPSGVAGSPPVVWWTPRGDGAPSGAPVRVRNHGVVCLGCHPCAPSGGRPRPGI